MTACPATVQPIAEREMVHPLVRRGQRTSTPAQGGDKGAKEEANSMAITEVTPPGWPQSLRMGTARSAPNGGGRRRGHSPYRAPPSHTEPLWERRRREGMMEAHTTAHSLTHRIHTQPIHDQTNPFNSFHFNFLFFVKQHLHQGANS